MRLRCAFSQAVFAGINQLWAAYLHLLHLADALIQRNLLCFMCTCIGNQTHELELSYREGCCIFFVIAGHQCRYFVYMFCVLWQGQLRNKVEQEVVDVCLGLQHLHGSISAVHSPDHRCSGSLTNIHQENFTGKHTLSGPLGLTLMNFRKDDKKKLRWHFFFVLNVGNGLKRKHYRCWCSDQWLPSSPFISLYPSFALYILFVTSAVPTRWKAQCFLGHGAPTVGKRPFHACPSHSPKSFHSTHFAFKCLQPCQEAVKGCKATNRHLKWKSRSAVGYNCLRRLASFLRDVAVRQKPQIFQWCNSAEWETNSSVFQFQSFL